MIKALDLDMIRARLKAWFESKMPQASEISVSPLERPGTGRSNETYFFDLQWRQGGEMKVEHLVIRWSPMSYKVFPKYDMKEQFMLMKHLENTSIPVPRARWLEEDKSVIGVPFYIVDRVEGWIPGDRYHVAGPLYEASSQRKAKIWWKGVDIISKIHALDWKGAGLGFLGVPNGGTDSIEQQIAYYNKILEMNEGPPPSILEATRDWLKKNMFEPKRISLCWGDARLGNLIYRGDEIVGVLDWEMACLGDTESDLGWFVHTDWASSEGHRHSPAPRLKGLPGIKETIAYYERITNRKVENLFYYEVFAAWRMAVLSTRLETVWKAVGDSPVGTDVMKSHFERLTSLLGL